jgi:triacylglycerol lipase
MPAISFILVAACILLVAGPSAAAASSSPPALHELPTGTDYVVLLHGLGRTAYSMKRLEWHLQRHGYDVVNVSYPSTRFSLEQLSDIYLQHLLAKRITNSNARIHFVTHSMGGILLRQYLSNHQIDNLGRVVMLAPPNQGSEIIDHLRSNHLAARILGPAAMELGTRTNDLPQRLGGVRFDCGVIAGDRSLNPFLSSLFPGPNDGKASVQRSHVVGMKDCLTLHTTHTWMMWRGQTLIQTLAFLQTGQFNRIKRAEKSAFVCSAD